MQFNGRECSQHYLRLQDGWKEGENRREDKKEERRESGEKGREGREVRGERKEGSMSM
jgi:hypothetical protein